MSRVTILFGPPGTGKTTRLLDLVDTFLAEGGNPARLVFSSFTRKAAHEARDRAAERFGLSPEELPYFRTLHSLAFRALGLRRSDVLSMTDYRDVARSLGLSVTGRWDLDGFQPGSARGDECLSIYAWHRARLVPLEAAWRAVGTGNVGLALVQQFVAALGEVQTARARLSFADMLDECHTPLDADLLILDEAQDLSPAQWQLARRLGANVPRIVVAGDDDQAIYDFAGAQSAVLRGLEGQREVLTQSYRLAAPIHTLAERVVTHVKTRVAKHYAPASHPGAVTVAATLDHVTVGDEGTYLFLARHNHQLPELEHQLRAAGRVYQLHGKWSTDVPTVRAAIAYERLRRGEAIPGDVAAQIIALVPGARWLVPTSRGPVRWHAVEWPFEGRPEWYTALSRLDGDDIAYVRALRRNREPLRGPGRVILSTIHGAKGGEADHVVLLTDITTKSYDSAWRAGDAEARVWYVGVTRARHTLTLVRSTGPRVWPGWRALGVGV